MRRSLFIILLLLTCCHTMAQKETDNRVDMTNPSAVVRAYLDACGRSDIDAAMNFVSSGDADLIKGLRKFMTSLNRRHGPGEPYASMAREMAVLPSGMTKQFEIADTRESDPGRVVDVTITRPISPTFVLVRADDGTWRIDLKKTLNSVAEGNSRFVRTAYKRADKNNKARMRTRRRRHLRALIRKLIQYASAHNDTLPEASQWMDELVNFTLDESLFHRPDVGDDGYGYAFNSAWSGEQLPEDRRHRGEIVLLYESDDLSRNAAGDPYSDLMPEGAKRQGRWIALASGRVGAVPSSVTVNRALTEWKYRRTAAQRLRALLDGLLGYARDSGGTLPGGDEWTDAIAPHMDPEEVAPETFKCPARPEAECGWAINKDLAGKDITGFGDHDEYVLLIPCEDCAWNEARKLPERLEKGYYLSRWHTKLRRRAYVGMLDGSLKAIYEGNAYPQPPKQ